MYNKTHSIQLQEAEPDNVYFNIDIVNDGSGNPLDDGGGGYTGEFRQATFDQTRANAIINRARDYYMSVIRFRVPLYTVPVMIWPVELGQTDPLVSSMQIGLSYENLDELPPINRRTYFTNVVLIPRNFFEPPVVLAPFEKQPNTQYLWVYDYENVIASINEILRTLTIQLVDDVNSTNPGFFPADIAKPFINWDPTSKLFYFETLFDYFVEQPELGTAQDPVIEIFWNTSFQRYFTGFPVQSITDGRYGVPWNPRRLIIEKYNNDPVEFDITTQNYPTVDTWTPMRVLLFESNISAIKGELTTLDSSFKKILVDAIPDEFFAEPRNDYVYFPNNNTRLVDIIDNSDVKKIQFLVKWLDIYGYEHVLYVPPYSFLNIKILFQKKSLKKVYQNKYE